MNDHINELAKILTQNLDDYTLELIACYKLNNMEFNTLLEFSRRIDKLCESVDKMINI